MLNMSQDLGILTMMFPTSEVPARCSEVFRLRSCGQVWGRAGVGQRNFGEAKVKGSGAGGPGGVQGLDRA